MNNVLQRGIEMFRSGDKEEARKLFVAFVKENPQSESGWKWMYNASNSSRERVHCLQQILKINPGNRKAKQLLDHMQEPGSRRQDIQAGKTRAYSLGAGAAVGVIILGLCTALVMLSTGFIRYNQTGTLCFFASSTGEPLCFSSGENAKPAANPAFAAPQVLPSAIGGPSTVPVMQLTATVTPLPTTVVTLAASPTTQLPLSPTQSFLPVSDTRLPADQWRKWPIVPDISLHAQQILREAVHNPSLDLHTFSKVGDCQMVAGIFLAGYANGIYDMPDGMDETVQGLGESMLTDNLTAVNGFGINTVLDPEFGLPAG